MSGLKELKNRIASVKATQKITKAMQMVASAKLRRAQEAAEQARPYADKMDSVLANLASGQSNSADAPKLLVGTGSDQRHLLLVASAERGLCGGFNTSIAKIAREEADRLIAEGKDVKILCVGRKAADVLRRNYSQYMLPTIDFRDVKRIGADEANKVAVKVVEMFNNNEFDVCSLFFAEFVSVIAQNPTKKRLIPAEIPEAEGNNNSSALYEFEPDETSILKDLLPQNLSVQILKALLENAVSEQGARMSAMDNATRNAGDMIDKLTLTYNRSRQAIITKELIEIISGAEAL